MKKIQKFLTPHIYANKVTDLNFSYLKTEFNIKTLIFDKDDTITGHHTEIVHGSLD